MKVSVAKLQKQNKEILSGIRKSEKNIFRTAYSPQKLHKSYENMNKTTKNSLKTEKQTINLKIKIYMLINSRINI